VNSPKQRSKSCYAAREHNQFSDEHRIFNEWQGR
jgi:hypothetical protein